MVGPRIWEVFGLGRNRETLIWAVCALGMAVVIAFFGVPIFIAVPVTVGCSIVISRILPEEER